MYGEGYGSTSCECCVKCFNQCTKQCVTTTLQKSVRVRELGPPRPEARLWRLRSEQGSETNWNRFLTRYANGYSRASIESKVRAFTTARAQALGHSKSIVIFDKRVKGRPWATVNYYAAVSPRYGGLHIQFVSGTKGPGYTAPRVYMVLRPRGGQTQP
eukprot:XP_001700699.1 predicted protein [Chlamydomonas reinhardtii]